MTSNIIHIRKMFPVSVLSTREAAQEIIASAQPGDTFDFDGIEFASSSFVDEFIDRLEQQDIILADSVQNLNPQLERLFETVLKRRQLPVRS
jgi:hypothetical protein